MSQSDQTVDRVKRMTDGAIVKAINANHPVVLETGDCYAADTLAMRLIHGRHDKREIVNLLRWCLMGCPAVCDTCAGTGKQGAFPCSSCFPMIQS